MGNSLKQLLNTARLHCHEYRSAQGMTEWDHTLFSPDRKHRSKAASVIPVGVDASMFVEVDTPAKSVDEGDNPNVPTSRIGPSTRRARPTNLRAKRRQAGMMQRKQAENTSSGNNGRRTRRTRPREGRPNSSKVHSNDTKGINERNKSAADEAELSRMLEKMDNISNTQGEGKEPDINSNKQEENAAATKSLDEIESMISTLGTAASTASIAKSSLTGSTSTDRARR